MWVLEIPERRIQVFFKHLCGLVAFREPGYADRPEGFYFASKGTAIRNRPWRSRRQTGQIPIAMSDRFFKGTNPIMWIDPAKPGTLTLSGEHVGFRLLHFLTGTRT
jgi:hypothetical protein